MFPNNTYWFCLHQLSPQYVSPVTVKIFSPDAEAGGDNGDWMDLQGQLQTTLARLSQGQGIGLVYGKRKQTFVLGTL